MSREARIPGGLSIRKTSGNVIVMDHRPAYNGFTADVDAAKGPTPAAVTVTASGTNIDLSQLTEPGWCELFNMSADQVVQYGIWDTVRHSFSPWGELEPGHGATFKLSRDFGERDDGPGTGTTVETVLVMRMYSDNADAVVYVGAFER